MSINFVYYVFMSGLLKRSSPGNELSYTQNTQKVQFRKICAKNEKHSSQGGFGNAQKFRFSFAIELISGTFVAKRSNLRRRRLRNQQTRNEVKEVDQGWIVGKTIYFINGDRYEGSDEVGLRGVLLLLRTF